MKLSFPQDVWKGANFVQREMTLVIYYWVAASTLKVGNIHRERNRAPKRTQGQAPEIVPLGFVSLTLT